MAYTSTKIFVKDKPIFARLKAMNDADLLATPVTAVPFCPRTLTAFARADIKTLGQVVQHARFDYLKMQNLGRKSVEQLEAYLEELGLELSASPEDVKPAPRPPPEPMKPKVHVNKLIELTVRQQQLLKELDQVNAQLKEAADGWLA